MSRNAGSNVSPATARPLRILHCLRAPVGGLFRHVCDLAEGQAAQGHAVGIIADSAGGGPAAARRLAALAPVATLGIERFPISRLPGAGDLAAARRIGRIAQSQTVDVLHGHGAKGGAYARLAPLFMSGPAPLRVYTPHGGSLHYKRSTPAGLAFLTLEGLLLRRTDLLIFESAYGQRIYEDKVGTPGCAVEVIHNGLAAGEFTPTTPVEDAADFVFVGELRHLKGVDVLLESLREIEGATAAIVGAGEARGELEALAERPDLAGRIRFAGLLPAREAFALGRCLVVPSRAESLPYVVLEGIAAGLPVVATDVGGISEIMGAEAGRLVPADDAPALAVALREVMSDPEAARRNAARLAEDVTQRFSLEGMVDGVLAAYAKALGPRSV